MPSESASISSDIFFNWLKNYFTPTKPPGEVLLILDGHTSHTNCIKMLEFAENNGILLLGFPPQTIHHALDNS